MFGIYWVTPPPTPPCWVPHLPQKFYQDLKLLLMRKCAMGNKTIQDIYLLQEQKGTKYVLTKSLIQK